VLEDEDEDEVEVELELECDVETLALVVLAVTVVVIVTLVVPLSPCDPHAATSAAAIATGSAVNAHARPHRRGEATIE
jgi:hypothetical protein